MAGKQRKVQVVVLCGGFGQGVLADLRAQIKVITDTHTKNAYRNLIKSASNGDEFVTEALLPVHRASTIYHMLCSMQTAQRLAPLENSVFFVHNEANRDQFFGSHYEGKGFIETAWAWGEVKLNKQNFVSNGATRASDWAGEAADLQVMLQSRLLDPSADLIVVRGSMSFVADYMFARLVEHPLVRNCSCLAYTQVEGPREAIMHWEPSPPVLMDLESPASSCTKLKGVQRATPATGECGALGLVFLKAADVPAMAGLPGSMTVEEMAIALLESGISMGGLNLQWGHFSVATLNELKYTESVFDAYSHALKHGKPKKDNKDRMSSLSLGEDITLLGVPGDTLKHHKETHTPETHLQDFAKDTDSKYFGDVMKSGGMQPEGNLPQTFYVSQYRRDVMKTQALLDLHRNWDERNKDSLQRISGKR